MLLLFCAQHKIRNDCTDYSLGCPLKQKNAFNKFCSQITSLIYNNRVMKKINIIASIL